MQRPFPVLFLALVLVLAALSARAGKGPPFSGVMVIDANGGVVGTFLGWPLNLGSIAVLRDGLILHLDVNQGTLANVPTLLFEGSGCTGAVWTSSAFANYLAGPVFQADLFAVGVGDPIHESRTILSAASSPLYNCRSLDLTAQPPLTPVEFRSAAELGFSLPLPAPLAIESALPR